MIAELPGVDPELYRRSVSLFATGIAVVTTVDSRGEMHGVTVNSFVSVSLAPPTVLVSLKPGKGHALIAESGWYGVSILSREQWDQCRYFSGRREGAIPPEIIQGRHVPLLAGSLARFECQVTQAVDVHDHTLFIAKVMACGAEAEEPLIFFASSQQQLASV